MQLYYQYSSTARQSISSVFCHLSEVIYVIPQGAGGSQSWVITQKNPKKILDKRQLFLYNDVTGHVTGNIAACCPFFSFDCLAVSISCHYP